MVFNAELKVNPTDRILKAHGLGEGGAVQKAIDNACIAYMSKYTPRRNGVLEKSVMIHTVIGSGQLVQATPYARFQYYGKVMTTTDGRVWAKRGEEKPVITSRNLVYSPSRNPSAGAKWFERMVNERKGDILKVAQAAAKRASE